MVTRIEPQVVSVPAGTPSVSPVEVSLSFPQGEVEWVDIVIPSGHNGFTGLALGRDGNRIWPSRGLGFLVANDTTVRWNLTNAGNSGRWSAFAYNTDGIRHRFYVYFGVSEIVPAEPGFTPQFVG